MFVRVFGLVCAVLYFLAPNPRMHGYFLQNDHFFICVFVKFYMWGGYDWMRERGGVQGDRYSIILGANEFEYVEK